MSSLAAAAVPTATVRVPEWAALAQVSGTGVLIGAIAGAAVLLLAGSATSAIEAARTDRVLGRFDRRAGDAVASGTRLPGTGTGAGAVPGGGGGGGGGRGGGRAGSLLERLASAGVTREDLAGRWRLPTAAAVGGAVAAVVTAPAVVAGACAVGGVIVVALPRVRAHRRRRRRPDRLVEVIDAVALRTAAGSSLNAALSSALTDVELEPDDALAGLAADLAAGAGVQASLDSWAERSPEPEAGLLADALAVASLSGGSIGSALVAVGDTIRERMALEREIAALGSQARLSARLLSIVPLGFAAVVMAIDGRVARFVFSTPAGWACLAIGISLQVGGALWMRRLVGSVR